jgi:hypothetical protein
LIIFLFFFSVVLIVSSFNNTEDNSEDSETEENLVKSSDDPTTKSEKRPTENNCKNNSETIKKEIVVLPWIDLTKLSVVNWEKIDLATADQDQIIREKLLLNSTASCFNEKNTSNCSGAGASAAAEPETVVNWLKKHQLSVDFQNKIISIQGMAIPVMEFSSPGIQN